MNQPNPAIVTQLAVRRLPRWALLLFCAAYVLPGFLGREPWKNADVAAFGYMRELALGGADWLHPLLLGLPPEIDALLPYWLGAWALQALPTWIAPALAVRLPFVAALALTFAATWYGVYHLARDETAQPVAFAFGGEAQPRDYARTLADASVLALMACLGLALLSHETTPAQIQLCLTALSFYAHAAAMHKRVLPSLALAIGLLGLSLSGAPAMGLLLGLGSAAISTGQRRQRRWALYTLGICLLAALLAWRWGLWHWRIVLPQGKDWRALATLLLWFTWPVGPLALWTLWRWRYQLLSPRIALHMGLPVWYALVALGTTALTQASDRSLLLALPALAVLAAFALPTLQRSVSSLTDWFSLMFFTGWAFALWLYWIALQTGHPAAAAATAARRLPGFVPGFSALECGVALGATLAWAGLVRWRVGRHRAALWKSMVLPAGGVTLGWLLLMTLWLPTLDHARSYAPWVARIQQEWPAPPRCVEVWGLTRGQIAALRYHSPLLLRVAPSPSACPYLLLEGDAQGKGPIDLDLSPWVFQTLIRRPLDQNESMLLYRRRTDGA